MLDERTNQSSCDWHDEAVCLNCQCFSGAEGGRGTAGHQVRAQPGSVRHERRNGHAVPQDHQDLVDAEQYDELGPSPAVGIKVSRGHEAEEDRNQRRRKLAGRD